MTFVAIAFNLLGNAMLSFGIALLLTCGFVAALRVGPSYGRVLLWLVPFAKLGYDLMRGIPGDSFLWLSVHGARQELGSFMLGFGLDAPFLPSIQAVLGSNVGGFRYSQSLADLLYRGLSQEISPALPVVIVSSLLGVAGFRLLRRLVGPGLPRARWPYRHSASRVVVLLLFVLFVVRSFFLGNS